MSNILYIITNKMTGKIYYGVTNRTIKKRWAQHCSFSRANTYLRQCIKKYGKENFVIEEVARFDDYQSALDAERDYIKKRQTNICEFPNGIGMNMTYGGDKGNRGYVTTEEHKKKLSAALIGKKKSQSHTLSIAAAKSGKRNPMYGKKPSELSIKKAKERMDGELNPMRGKRGELNPNYGKKRPPEVREKILRSVMKRAKPVIQIDIETGKELAVFESTHAANRALGIKNGVYSVCVGERKSAGGFFWKFKEKKA